MDKLKKKTKNQAPVICKCKAKVKTKAKSPVICTCGAETKANRQLEEDEREMETIMPYSKKTFKKLKSQSQLPTREQHVCSINCGSFKTGRQKRRERGRETGDGSPGFGMTLDPKEARERGFAKGKGKGRYGKETAKGVNEPVDNSPLFEVTLNSANMNVVNKEEVLKEMSKISEEAARKKEKGKQLLKCIVWYK